MTQKEALTALAKKAEIEYSDLEFLIPASVDKDEPDNNIMLHDQKHEFVVSSKSWTGSETCETGFSASTLGMGLSVSGLEIGATAIDVGAAVASVGFTGFVFEGVITKNEKDSLHTYLK
jgi:hypothetical protein